jgi:hypothetical protein
MSSDLHKILHPIYIQCELKFTITVTLNFYKKVLEFLKNMKVYIKNNPQFLIAVYHFSSHHNTDLHPVLRATSLLYNPITSCA